MPLVERARHMRRAGYTGSKAGQCAGQDCATGTAPRNAQERRAPMKLDTACDTSPFGVAVNRTGTRPAQAHRDAEGYWQEFLQEWSGEWVHAPLFHALAVAADPDGWEPVLNPNDLPDTLRRRIA